MHRFTKTGVLASLMAVALSLAPVWAQRGDDAERLSKNGKTQGSIDNVEITLEYGRPSVKGRKIWGGLVPYDRVWRTGADEATTLEVTSDIAVEGQVLPAGVYSLFTIPGEAEWTVIFNTVSEQWGAFNYDETKDALRVAVTPETAEFVESLELLIEDSDVILRWGELAVPFRISASQ
jgi:hypothetical protein